MRALVTGSNGFIGSHLAAVLAKQGHDVFCLIRRTSVTKGLEGLKTNRVLGDIRDKSSLAVAVKGMDYVFHLAGVLDAPDSETHFDVNTGGTRNLLEACREANSALRKFVFVSSVSAARPQPVGKVAERGRRIPADLGLRSEQARRRKDRPRPQGQPSRNRCPAN